MNDKTQMMGGSPTIIGGTQTMMGGATVMGGDPFRTQMGVPSLTTIDVECLSGNRYAMAGETSREHALIILKAGGQSVGRRAPLNICLVIDRSGSMEGPPLEYAKRACEYVVYMLEPNDILSIVTFEEVVDVLMPARRVINKALVKEHINRLEVGNTTNLYDGLMAGCMQIASVMSQTPGYVSRVLLLTDGEPTSGLKDFTSIVQQAAEQKARGISITALGFGSEYNEELMAGIAKRSGGNYYHIQRPDLLPEVFRKELETMMTIVARDVNLKLHLTRGTSVRQVYNNHPSFSGRTVEVTLPDIERGTVRTVLLDLELGARVAAPYRVAKVELFYNDVVNNRPSYGFADCLFEFTLDRGMLPANVNLTVRNELEIAQASMNLQKTMMGMRTQSITSMGALQEMEKTRAILVHAGQTTQALEMTRAMQAVQGGASAEKTLMGTIMNLDGGKRE